MEENASARALKVILIYWGNYLILIRPYRQLAELHQMFSENSLTVVSPTLTGSLTMLN